MTPTTTLTTASPRTAGSPIWVMKRTSRPSWIASMASEQAMDTAVSKSSSPA